MRPVVLTLALLAVVLLLAGLAGALHPAADTLALGRPMFGLIALAGAVAARPRAARLGFFAIGLAGLAALAPMLRLPPPGGDIRIYSKNVWAGNYDPTALAADIAAAEVEVVLLQEVSNRNALILDLLAPHFPHLQLCWTPGRSGVAILSRLPFDGAPRCTDQPVLAAAPIRLDGDRVWLVSAHVPWLWPYASRGAETEATAMLAGLDAPAVIAGDFNAFPWTNRIRRIAAATDTRLAGPVRPTLFVRRVPLPIDLALAPGGGRLERRPPLGSDHYGIVADLSLTP